jgi:hypothetical protein
MSANNLMHTTTTTTTTTTNSIRTHISTATNNTQRPPPVVPQAAYSKRKLSAFIDADHHDFNKSKIPRISHSKKSCSDVSENSNSGSDTDSDSDYDPSSDSESGSDSEAESMTSNGEDEADSHYDTDSNDDSQSDEAEETDSDNDMESASLGSQLHCPTQSDEEFKQDIEAKALANQLDVNPLEDILDGGDLMAPKFNRRWKFVTAVFSDERRSSTLTEIIPLEILELKEEFKKYKPMLWTLICSIQDAKYIRQAIRLAQTTKCKEVVRMLHKQLSILS